MKEDLLFYDAYEEFYKMASTSETFRDFCIDAYGADFSQDGFSDVKQIDMIVPFIMNSDAHVLDIGCGNGKMIKYLGDKTGAYIHGFDYSDNAIMHAKTNNDSGDFRVGVIGKIEYSKESFDVIVAMDSMYFAPDMASFVSQIRNWLKPGGVLFVAYQEGDVMDKTANEDTTAFAEAMRVIGWEYEVKDISEDSYDMLMNKRKVALAYKDRFEGEDNGTWGDMLIEQTDYVLQGKEEYLKHLARYIYVCRK